MILDNGAYSSWGATTPLVMMMTISSLYRVPNVKYDVLVVYTNNPYAGAMRGYGNPQATFVVESHMDMLAHELGMDPIEFRLKNANQPGDVTGQGVKITTCGLSECIEKAAESIGWQEKRGRVGNRGVGMAAQLHVGGGARIYPSDGCGTTIKVDDYGKVTVITGSGSTDMGQGSETVIAQIVAEEMGVPVDNITVINTDTDITPWDVGAHATRTTFIARPISKKLRTWTCAPDRFSSKASRRRASPMARRSGPGTFDPTGTSSWRGAGMNLPLRSRTRNFGATSLLPTPLLLRPLKWKWTPRRGK
jgi:xanthine dehydrogenase molybdenum-binding subunit